MINTYNYIFILFVLGTHSMIHGIYQVSTDCKTSALITNSFLIVLGIMMIALGAYQSISILI